MTVRHSRISLVPQSAAFAQKLILTQLLTQHPWTVEIAGSGAVGPAVSKGELDRPPSPAAGRVTSVADPFDR